jgi:hypothetical protein
MQRPLIMLGVAIVLAGLLWPWLSKLPLGRLPGDVIINKPGFKVFFPFTSMILASAALSLILWLLRR